MKIYRGKVTIKQLIVGVVSLAFFLSLASSMFSSYQGNLRLIQNQYLQKNETYAMKLAQVVNLFLRHNSLVLGYSTPHIREVMDNDAALKAEVERLFQQNHTFNSVVVANADGVILAGAPEKYALKGQTIKSPEGLEIIKNQKPTITDPYRASTGKILIIVSQPIFSENGEYKGLLNGTIYIHESTFFSDIIGNHKSGDGTYVFVVDSVGRLIYHPDETRIWEDVSSNEAVKKLITGESGYVETTNKLGIEMLAAFKPLENTNWGIVVQTPKSTAVKSVESEVLEMFYFELPLILISMLFVIFLVWKIVQPLQKLAHLADSSIQESGLENLTKLNAWYFEALQIKNALIRSFTDLHGKVNLFREQSTIDPLTQLTNRRTLDTVLQFLVNTGKPFSIILIDLDHFKSINDTYGHAMGDQVLKYTADLLKQVTSDHEICCRYGGEEFMIILPESNGQHAYKIADHLKHLIRQIEGPLTVPITFSAGIATFPEDATSPYELIDIADKALYKAKAMGRNRIEMAIDLTEM